jgi:hypothetical protein
MTFHRDFWFEKENRYDEKNCAAVRPRSGFVSGEASVRVR